jgi:hypothetical protein
MALRFDNGALASAIRRRRKADGTAHIYGTKGSIKFILPPHKGE